MLKSVPVPRGNLHRWANEVSEYLRAGQDVASFTDPKPILLVHQVAGQMARATSDGVLMYDPTEGAPVYSEGGGWLPVASQGYVDGALGAYLPLAGGTVTGTVTLTNAGSLADPVLDFQAHSVTWGIDTTAGDDFRVSRDGSAFLTLNSGGSTIASGLNVSGDVLADNGSNASYTLWNGNNSTHELYRTASAANSNFLEIYSDVFTTKGTVFLIQNDGDVQNYNNSYGAISDERIKENIADAPSKIAEYRQLRIRRFNRKGDPNKTVQVGLIAQEVQQVEPRLVSYDEDNGLYGVRYSLLVPWTVKVLQEVMDGALADRARINDLEARVAALEGAG